MGEGGGTGPRQIRVSLQDTDMKSVSFADMTMYAHLLFKDGIFAGVVKSKFDFSSFPHGWVKEAPFKRLDDLKDLAERNHAVINYSPALMEGLKARADYRELKEKIDFQEQAYQEACSNID